MADLVPVEVAREARRTVEKEYEFTTAVEPIVERTSLTQLERQLQNYTRQEEGIAEQKAIIQAKIDAINALPKD